MSFNILVIDTILYKSRTFSSIGRIHDCFTLQEGMSRRVIYCNTYGTTVQITFSDNGQHITRMDRMYSSIT